MQKIDFRILSNLRCQEPGCHKRLKQNLVNRHPEAKFCYRHDPNSKKNRPGADPKKFRKTTEPVDQTGPAERSTHEH